MEGDYKELNWALPCLEVVSNERGNIGIVK